MPAPPFHSRKAAAHWSVLAFIAAFSIGIIFLSVYYLLPALDAFLQADRIGDHRGKMAIRATSALLLSVILVILLAGVLLTFRIGRLFFPRPRPPRTKTTYVDAWSESAKRMQTPPEE
jgi:hypothetical protein